jgi:rSAM/selenodomain-associated transferase 2
MVKYSDIKISVIIPTFNEEENIVRLLSHLHSLNHSSHIETIIADGNSSDQTLRAAQDFDTRLVSCIKTMRAHQMNEGAQMASGNVLYFIHADTLPPSSCFDDLISALSSGAQLGGFRFVFDSPKIMLKFNSWMTRFNILAFRGGDQTIFITQKLWEKLRGFDEYYCVMEEYDLLRRASKAGIPYKLIPKPVLVSARKYDRASWLRVNFANTVATLMFRMNCHPRGIKRIYARLLAKDAMRYDL